MTMLRGDDNSLVTHNWDTAGITFRINYLNSRGGSVIPLENNLSEKEYTMPQVFLALCLTIKYSLAFAPS